MPISRFHIRSEHSLADPELHRSAEKEDPEALLEAVAMAGLVGVLRQLGDLAQFAAEIFHDLHEEVLATAARGHRLVSRVQQLEDDVPALEKAILSQTHHSSFFTNGGIDWHPNLRSEQNLITSGDMPRFIMDSYEECRAPPRLFLLDKFDVAGAGACLKRYTDPSFFKVDSASPVMETVEVHREKVIRKVKKKVAQPRNGESPVSSHAKLHQLFLEERIENACRDPARLVKLKKKQLNGSAVESKSGKSYMGKILDISSPDHKMVSETSTTPLPVQLMSDDSSENGIKILEISSVSPVKRSLGNESTHSSPDEQELEMKTFSEMNWETNGDIMHVHEEVSATASVTTSNHPKVVDDTESRVDELKKREYFLDGYHSDDVTSEVDDYMDALATMEEFETDMECRPKKSLMHIQKITDSNGKEEHHLQAQFSHSQLCRDSLTSEEISSFNRDGSGEHAEGQAPMSDSHSSRSSSASEDNRLTRRDRVEHYQQQAQFLDSQSIGNSSTSEMKNLPSNQLFKTVELPKAQFSEFVMHHGELVYEKGISDCRPVSSGSDLMDSGLSYSDHGSTLSVPVGTQSGETPAGNVEMHSRSVHEDRNSHVESTFVISDALSSIKDDCCHMVSSDNKSLNNLDVCDPFVNSNEFSLAYDDEYDDHSMTKLLQEESPNQHISEILSSADTGSQGEDPICPSMEADFNSGTKFLLDGLDFKSENGVIATQYNSEDLSPVVETPVSSFAEELCPDFTQVKPQGEPDSAEAEVFYSVRQSNFEGVSRMMLGDGHIKRPSFPDIKQDNLVIVNDVSTGKVHSEEQPLSSLSLVDRAENDASIFTSEVQGFVSSPSRNLSDLHEPFSTPSNSHLTVIESNEAELTEISEDLHSEKRKNKLQPSSDTIPSSMKRHSNLKESHSTFADSYEKEVEVNEKVAKESLTFVVPKQVDQPVIASADVQPNLNRSVPCDFSDSEICHNTQEDDIRCSSDVNDTKIVSVSPELDSQRLESIFLCQNDVQNIKDSLSSPFHEVGQQDAAVWVRNEEYYTSEKCQLQQIEISNQLEQQRISVVAPEMHRVQYSSFDSSPKSSFQESNYTKHATVLSQPILPDFIVKPTNNHEGMPPLPPLPPMQWRMGKVQHTSPVSQIEEIEGSITSSHQIQPVKLDDKSQFGLSRPDRDTIFHQNPFLPFMAVDSNMLQHSSGCLAGVSEHPVAMPLQFPIMVNEPFGQYNYLVMERTQNQNPFLTLPVVSMGGPPHGYVYGSEGEMVQSSSPCPSIPPAECSVSEADPISPQEKLTESPTELMEKTSLEVKDGPGELRSVLPTECAVSGDDHISPKATPPPLQLMEETGQEVEKLEQPSIDLESKQEGHPSISIISPPSIDIKQPDDSTLPLEGGMSFPLDTSARAPELDSKMPNGKPKNKLPFPQIPSIDIVAAIDKSRLRKVSERVRPQIAPKVDERDSLLEQIRSKSFNLRPAVATRPIIQGPRTNLRVAAILEKANSIRQALTGSDEDDDADSWSDS